MLLKILFQCSNLATAHILSCVVSVVQGPAASAILMLAQASGAVLVQFYFMVPIADLSL